MTSGLLSELAATQPRGSQHGILELEKASSLTCYVSWARKGWEVL